ncbi:MAG: mercuric reductase [Leptospiraceae bacterium]|nr:MAG: mercuric reductase [Leptospiraceae bacterium]
MKKLILKISGMTCQHCADTIENIVKKLEGIHSVKIDYNNHSGEVEFNENQISYNDIINAIHKTHYKVIDSEMKELEINSIIKRHSNQYYDYDVIIIGGGSAAFSSAIKANELGLKNVIINDGLPIGGTCVNVGCLPSKNLIRLAEYLHQFSYSNYPFIPKENLKGIKIDFKTIIKQKKELVEIMREKKYLSILKSLSNTDFIKGYGKLLDKNSVMINDNQTITGKNIIIATGSSTYIPPIKGLDNITYFTNDTLFELEELPEHLIIIGGGYIGLEIAQAYKRFGSNVSVIEYFDRVLPNQSEDISNTIAQYLEQEGIRIFTNTKVLEVRQEEKTIIIKGEASNNSFEIKGTHLLIATGRKPNTKNLNLEQVGVNILSSGHIQVNSYLQTNIPNIYAIGDCNQLPAFVYTAAYEGNIAIQNIVACCKEELQSFEYNALPWVIFTDPQIAGCGKTEIELLKENRNYQKTILPIKEIPRFSVSYEEKGFIKLLRDPETDLFLGAEIICKDAGELIMLISFAIKYNITVEEFSKCLFPYLTAVEGLKLASLTFQKDVSKLSCCAF